MKDEDRTRQTKSRKVLLAEDSSVTQDLIQLILTQRGHTVDICSDGQSAISQLLITDYDVALLDFHLPDMTGLDIVDTVKRQRGTGRLPRFIAITGDVGGLLGDSKNCELFEDVVPKPLDIDLIGSLIEQTASHSPQADNPIAPQVPDHSSDHTETAGYPSSHAPRHGLTLLNWPNAMHLNAAECDAVEVSDVAGLDQLWQIPGVHLLPVIDSTGTLGIRADIEGASLESKHVPLVHAIVKDFHERRAALHPDLLVADNDNDRLLGRISVSGGTLFAKLDPNTSALVQYNTICPTGAVEKAITALAARDLIRTVFHDRLHVCGACRSSRFNVCEQCQHCSSAHLTEETYLHHFRCAYQGIDSDFRAGDELICPKCRRRLSQFGHDYDRPGVMAKCEACGHASSEPSVVFHCLDCGAQHQADSIAQRDVNGATLTEQAENYMLAGQAFFGPTQQNLRFSDLPLEMIVALNRAARAYNEMKEPLALAYVVYEKYAEVSAASGPRASVLARRQFFESMIEATDASVTTARGNIHDFVLLQATTPVNARKILTQAAQRAERDIHVDLGAGFRIFGAEDISG